MTQVVSLGNEELEYEIRSGQSFGIQYALQSVYRIYLQRAMVYFVWFTLFGLLCLVVFDFLGCSAFDSSGLTNSLFFEGHQFPRVARSTDWFPDFSRLLSCHDSTNHPFPTDFSLDRFSKHRALILLRTRLSSGEFWESEEII